MNAQASLFDAEESKRRRDRGRTSAVSRHHGWLTEARRVALQLAHEKGTVTADDVRAAGVETPDGASPNVWGSVFLRDVFEHVGYTHSARPEAHRNLLRVWRLKP
ncbi:MAG: hypothetical protein AB7E70_20275 [Hyphomicrobiaceae bacterium]